jgi:AraC-like DNA-binding protein
MADPGFNRFGTIPNANGGLSRLAYVRAKAEGIDVAPLLKKSGLMLQQMNDAKARVKVGDQISFLNLIANALQDEFLGFHLAVPCDPREIGLLYYVAATSGTLIEALQRTARYSSIVNEGVAIKCNSGKKIEMAFNYVGVSRHLDRHQIEFFVTMLVRVCRTLTGKRLLPNVRLSHHRNAMDSEFQDFFGSRVEFGAAADVVTFPASTRDQPVVSADPYLNDILVAYCDEAMAHDKNKVVSFRSTVETLIAQLLPHGNVRANEIARRLGLSPRSFARRLAAEHASYSEVLKSLRLHLADRFLADDSLSISQIAWLLGYQEVSAFTHAYKRQTGKSPRETRAGSPSTQKFKGRRPDVLSSR